MTEKLFAVRSSVSSTAASATAPKRNTSGHELAEALRESEERYRMLLDGIQNYARAGFSVGMPAPNELKVIPQIR